MSSDGSLRTGGAARRTLTGPGAGVGGRSRRAFAGALTGWLALSAAGCIGENPVDVNARARIFSLLGGLEVGSALTLEGRQAERIALPGNAGGAEFVIVPFLGTDQDATVTVGIEGATMLDAVGPPAARAPARPSDFLGRPDLGARAATARFHERLRRSEIERLGPSLRSMDRRAAELRPAAASGPAAVVPVVGDILSLRAINDAAPTICDAPLERGGRVAAVSDRAIIVSDTASPVELTTAQLEAVAADFDALLYPVGVESFGAPTDLDENGRVIIFFTPVVNDADALGFFFAGDLFTQSSCPASNEGEIVFIVSPDPFGETGLQIDADDVAFLASDIVVHELQHLINASRRVYVNGATELEDVWLNEGLSHIAEELVFYALTPFGPGENVDLDDLRAHADIANRFILGNQLFYASYALDPAAASFTGSADAATRGAAWAFLRYAADHEGRGDTDFFRALVNSTTNGLQNLNGVLETGEALDLVQAWTASVFSDDYVTGVPDFLTQPSWNFRSSLPALMSDGTFPLDPVVVQTNGSRTEVTLNGGGSAFFRVHVGAGSSGEIQLDVAGASTALRVTVVRSR